MENTRIVEVVFYNPKWIEEFALESENIKNIMEKEIVNIHHIGSTSIPGICAKPIIDILIEVKDIKCIDSYNKNMEGIGYIAKGEYGISGRRFFLKGLYERTHHLHIFQVGNHEIQRHLLFRDYMIAHPLQAKKYESLKKELAVKYKYNIEGYCNGKDSFIRSADEKAKVWAENSMDGLLNY